MSLITILKTVKEKIGYVNDHMLLICKKLLTYDQLADITNNVIKESIIAEYIIRKYRADNLVSYKNITISKFINNAYGRKKILPLSLFTDTANSSQMFYSLQDTHMLQNGPDLVAYMPVIWQFSWNLSRDTSNVSKGLSISKVIKNISAIKLNTMYIYNFYDFDMTYRAYATFKVTIDELLCQSFMTPDNKRWHFNAKINTNNFNYWIDTNIFSYNANNNGIFEFDPPVTLLDKITLSLTNLNTNHATVANTTTLQYAYAEDNTNPIPNYQAFNNQPKQMIFNIEIIYEDIDE